MILKALATGKSLVLNVHKILATDKMCDKAFDSDA